MKEKRKLSPLKIGERVRVYGRVQMHHSPYKPRGGGPATVTYVEDERFIHVKFDDEETHYSAHPRQCVRLKPKKAPAAPERVEVWTVRPQLDQIPPLNSGSISVSKAKFISGCGVHLVELRQNEVIVNFDKLVEEIKGRTVHWENILRALRLGFKEEREP